MQLTQLPLVAAVLLVLAAHLPVKVIIKVVLVVIQHLAQSLLMVVEVEALETIALYPPIMELMVVQAAAVEVVKAVAQQVVLETLHQQPQAKAVMEEQMVLALLIMAPVVVAVLVQQVLLEPGQMAV